MAQQQQPLMAQQQQQQSLTAQQQQQQQQQEEQRKEQNNKEDRALIHIDSRERDVDQKRTSNPLVIVMESQITCLVSVRDIIIHNIHNDPYLLIQIEESNRGVFENQLRREIHFKLVKVETSKDSSYYKNSDSETMIRLRNISKITFNIIRPNGKLLYSNVSDIFNINVISRENAIQYFEKSNTLTSFENNMILITTDNMDLVNVNEGDTVALFNNRLDKSEEFKIIYINTRDNIILLECSESKELNPKATELYSKLLINKYQISITLEII
jgi:hypothetical protein